MVNQNQGNHARYIPLWHFITSAAILALLAGSIASDKSLHCVLPAMNSLLRWLKKQRKKALAAEK
jgi:hypothetical protein